jgi:hypothetical protein
VEIAPNEYKDPEYQEFEIGEEEFAYWTDEWMKRVELYHLSN